MGLDFMNTADVLVRFEWEGHHEKPGDAAAAAAAEAAAAAGGGSPKKKKKKGRKGRGGGGGDGAANDESPYGEPTRQEFEHDQFMDVRGNFESQSKLTVVTPCLADHPSVDIDQGMCSIRVSLDGDSLTLTKVDFYFFAVADASKCLLFGPGVIEAETLSKTKPGVKTDGKSNKKKKGAEGTDATATQQAADPNDLLAANEECVFVVQAKDDRGRNRKTGGDEFDVAGRRRVWEEGMEEPVVLSSQFELSSFGFFQRGGYERDRLPHCPACVTACPRSHRAAKPRPPLHRGPPATPH